MFDLGRVIQMDKPLTTQCNTTDPFRTGRGTFLLRARHGEEFGARVEYLHYIIDHLCAHGFPAAPVMRAQDGSSWTTWGERIVEIHGFVPHDPGVHRDWRRMYAAATALGDLHRILGRAAVGKTPGAARDAQRRFARADLDLCSTRARRCSATVCPPGPTPARRRPSRSAAARGRCWSRCCGITRGSSATCRG